MNGSSSWRPGRWAWLGAVLGGLVLLTGCSRPAPRVVLYCAQDEEFAQQLLEKFRADTGLAVDAKYDTEADKSVSLYTELVQEKDRPRCDVYWNNEILSTIRLQREGLLEPYASPRADAFPAWARAKDHTWCAFAERARVLLVNRQRVPQAEWPDSILDLTQPRWRGQVAMAKPQFGTSATQAACLFEILGAKAAKDYYLGLRKNDVQIVAGNKQVAEGVGAGQFLVGITDTDDAMAEVAAGHPVAILFPDGQRPKNERLGTLFIPNTVAILRGAPHAAGARQLVDYLLSPEVERQLAEAESHQIPMNPDVHAQLPPEIKTRRDVKAMDADFEKAAGLWAETQEFLRTTFAR